MAKQIPLTRGMFALVDDIDYERLMQHKWCVNAQGYAVRGWAEKGVRHMERMHRVILGDACNGFEVDHINCNRLDNRRCNLRIATRAENARNRRKINRPTSSKYLGVRLAKGRKRYTARIHINGKELYLGQFDRETDAAKAYNDAAIKYFGDYARLNNI